MKKKRNRITLINNLDSSAFLVFDTNKTNLNGDIPQLDLM